MIVYSCIREQKKIKWAMLLLATWHKKYVRFDRHFAFFFSSFKFPFLWGNYLLDYTAEQYGAIHIFYYLKNIFIFALYQLYTVPVQRHDYCVSTGSVQRKI